MADSHPVPTNRIYETNLTKDKIDRIQGFAKFLSPSSVSVNGATYEATKFLIATGSYAWIPDTPGARDFGMISDGFFELNEQPKKVAVVGAGYIGIELAGIFQNLGTQTSLFIRHHEFLRTFDPIIRCTLMEEYKNSGMHVGCALTVTKVENLSTDPAKKNLRITALNHVTNAEEVFEGYEHIIFAVGRKAHVETLGLDKASVKLDHRGYVVVNEWQETNVEGVYAVGDVCGVAMLTPVAIAAGRRLSDRLFGGKKDSKLDYTNIPSVIFSHPTAGSIGLTEQEAIDKFGKENIKIYQSKFTNMYFSMTGEESFFCVKE